MLLRISVILLQISIATDFWTASEVLAVKHRCYVCVPKSGSSISDVLQTFPHHPPIPLCNQFQVSHPDYIRECPLSSDQGCLTQINGSHVTKTCTEVGLEDCKTANRIRYCYCKGDLCNKEAVPAEAPAPLPPQQTETAEDDEDSLAEGSGSNETPDRKHLETSSEADLGIEVIPNHFTTTIKSVILTTSLPGEVGTAKANANLSSRPFYILFFIPFLLVLKL